MINYFKCMLFYFMFLNLYIDPFYFDPKIYTQFIKHSDHICT